MPTRSGQDFSEISPDYFVCAYCYEATSTFLRFGGMVTKSTQIRVDDEFVTLPGEYTEIWTEPHCYRCHRQILGWPLYAHYPRKHKY